MINKVLVPNVLYNSQRDNKIVEGISQGSQCGYTSLAMILSQTKPEFGSDAFVSKMVLEMEGKKQVFREAFLNGKIESYIKKLINVDKYRVGAFMEAYQQYANSLNIGSFRLVRSDSPDLMKSVLDKGIPIMLGTIITASGHYVVVVGYDENGWIVNDPWGDGVGGYKNKDGKEKVYPYKWLSERINDLSGKKGKIRAIYKEVT